MSSETPGSIWTRPQPGARKPRLTRAQIAAAALAIADRDGLDAVSMRRLSAALEVGTMTLYYYVRTKEELIELMHDAMIADVLVPDGELPDSWRGALTAIANRTRATFHRHPWAIEGPPVATGPNALRHFEQSLAAVAGLDVDPAARFEIITMLDDYVFGFVLRELQEHRERITAGGNESWTQAMTSYVESQLGTGSFPHIERLLEGDSVRAVLERLAAFGEDEERFGRGLDRLLDGIALSLERLGVDV